MQILPNDLILEIILKLDVKDIYRCRCVSKLWLNLIQTPFLSFAQFKKTPQINNTVNTVNDRFIIIPGGDLSSLYAMDFLSPENLTVARVMEIDYPLKDSEKPIKLVGTCDGLICIENTNLYHYEQYYYYPSIKTFFTLWNPFTGIYRIVPDKSVNTLDFWSEPKIDRFDSYCYFGYDHLVRVTMPYTNPPTRLSLRQEQRPGRIQDYGFVLDVYSLKNDAWTKFINPKIQNKWDVYVRSGVLISDTLYLIVKKKENDNTNTVPFVHKILAFNLATKTFRLMDLPRQYKKCYTTQLESILGELKGRLSVKKCPWLCERNHLVWLMNDEDDMMNEKMWSKTFEFVTSDSIILEKLLSYFSVNVCGANQDTSQQVIGMLCGNYMWCDPKTKLTTDISVEKLLSSSSIYLVKREACVCLRTMVSPF